MNSFTSLIIDDEHLSRFALRKKLSDFSNIEIIGEASCIKEAVLKINNLKPQLLFLDIQLTDGTGFDLLNRVQYEGKIIFITAYDEYAIRAFEINAVDYLLKPVSTKRLKNAIEKLYDINSQGTQAFEAKLDYNDRLMVMRRKSVNFIKIDKIISINASREYTYINTSDGSEYLTSKSIGEWESRLPDEHFCRIHRSTIINFDYIVKIDHHLSGPAEVFVHGHSEPFFISRNYFRKLKERYSL